MPVRWLGFVLAFAAVISACSTPANTRVVVGAGTTLVDSQFMAELVAAYEVVEPATQLSVVGLSSAEAIALAEAGDADVIITHNRAALDEFLGHSQASIRYDVFVSQFFIGAPGNLGIAAVSLDDALRQIAARSIEFISRDDGSGTHAAELSAWAAAGIDPSGQTWYVRTGTGMGATLQVTDQRGATTLAEHGAFLASSNTLSLVGVDHTMVPNPYDLTVVDPDANGSADDFALWLTSPDGIAAIESANSKLFGQQVYVAP